MTDLHISATKRAAWALGKQARSIAILPNIPDLANTEINQAKVMYNYQ